MKRGDFESLLFLYAENHAAAVRLKEKAVADGKEKEIPDVLWWSFDISVTMTGWSMKRGTLSAVSGS